MEIRTTGSSRETENPNRAQRGARHVPAPEEWAAGAQEPICGRSLLRAAKLAGKSFVGRWCSRSWCPSSSMLHIGQIPAADRHVQRLPEHQYPATEEIIRKEFLAHLMQIDLKQLRNRWKRRPGAAERDPARSSSELVIYVQERVPR